MNDQHTHHGAAGAQTREQGGHHTHDEHSVHESHGRHENHSGHDDAGHGGPGDHVGQFRRLF